MQQTEILQPETIPKQGALPELANRLAIHYLNTEQQRAVYDLCGSSEGDLPYWLEGERSVGRVEDALANISRTEWPSLNVQYTEATRLFCGGVLDQLSSLERSGETEAAQVYTNSLYEALFSGSPNITTYSGGPREQFKLLALAQATPLARGLTRPMIGELAYNAAFDYERDVFVGVMDGLRSVEQLQSVRALESIAWWGMGNGEWAMPGVQKVITGLEAVAADERNSILVRKVAAGSEQAIQQELGLEWVDLEKLPQSEQQQLLAERAERENNFRDTQEQLSQEFPRLSSNESSGPFRRHQLLRVSTDCAAVVEGGVITQLERHSGDAVAVGLLDTVHGSTAFGLDAEQSLVLAELHRPSVRNIVERDLGLDLSDISLAAQVHLLQYMAGAQTDVYDRLSDMLCGVPDTDRAELAEAFLALEFGDDFGGILLDVAGKNPDQAVSLVRKIREVRDAAQVIGNMFVSDEPLDQALAQAVPTAFIKRTTELLALAKRNGIEATLSSLDAVHGATQQIAEALQQDRFGISEIGGDYGTFRAVHHPVSITFRPSGHNARLGFNVKMGKGKERLSIRLDYEAGRLSLDIGSTAQHDVRPSEVSRQVGQALAMGELALAELRAERVSAHDARLRQPVLHGNHVREAFQHMPDLYPEEFSGALHRFLYRLRLAGSTAPQTAGEMSEQSAG